MFRSDRLNFRAMSDDLSDQLRMWLNSHQVKKTELAAALRIKDSQVITNWIGRKSIPKRYLDQVRALVLSPNWKEGKAAIKAAERNSLGKNTSREPGSTLREATPRATHDNKTPQETRRDASETLDKSHKVSRTDMRNMLDSLSDQQLRELFKIAISLSTPEEAAIMAELCLKRVREGL